MITGVAIFVIAISERSHFSSEAISECSYLLWSVIMGDSLCSKQTYYIY